LTAWIWISKKVEEKYLNKAVEHLDKVALVAESLMDALNSFLKKDLNGVKEHYSRVFTAERTADQIKRDVISDMFESSIHPIDREVIMKLILRIDYIADHAKSTARRLLLAAETDLIIPIEILNDVIEMCHKLREAISNLREALLELTKDLKKSLELANAVEKIEEEVDEVRSRAFEKVLLTCKNSDPATCTILNEVVDSLENAVDRCEDSADMIRYLAVSLK